MRSRYPLVLAAMFTMLLAPALPASATGFPDPAPLGPQRPYEPDVAGPTTIASATVSVRRDGGSRWGIEASVDSHTRTASGEKPAAGRRNVFLFDRSVRFNPDAFPTCARIEVERHGAQGCPQGSQVGSGRVEFYPAGAADIAVFNTRYPNGMRGMLITIPALGTVLENTFEPVSRPYRPEFAWASDEIVPPDAVAPQDRSASTRFQLTIGATYRGHSYMESFAPTGHPLSFGGWSETVTGQVIMLTIQAPRP
jgi:hypothetical protein